MKTFLLSVLCAAALVMGMSAEAMAVGTTAGTVISNQAYADYKDANGNAMTRIYSNTVTTVVSQVAAVSIDPPTGSQTAQNGTDVYYLIQLFNNGNAADAQTFTYTTSGAWTPTAVRFFYDMNNNHTYEPGVDPLLTETSPGSRTYVTTKAISPDDDYDLYMVVTVPAVAQAPNNTNSVVTVSTKSNFDNSKMATGVYTTTVNSAVITAAKTHTPTSPKPGETVTYTITLNNTGSAAGSNVLLTDLIPANFTYKPGSITLRGTAKTDANDADEANFGVTAANTVTVNVGNLAAAASAVITFQVTLNGQVTAGTAITNQATITYQSGGNNLSTQSNGDTLFVATAASVDIAATVTVASGNPGSRIVLPFTVTNLGNNADVIDLTYASSQGWTWAIWVDANGDGLPGTNGDYLLTDTDADGKIDTGALAANRTLTLLAVATVPVGSTNGLTDTVTITAISSLDTTKSDLQAFTTTIKAPVLTIAKAVSPTGAQPPQTVLTYTVTVTNVGDGDAKSVIISDLIPNYTTYVTGSIRTGSTLATLTARTDAADGDGAEYDAGAKAVIGGSVDQTLGKNGVLILEFKARIN